MLSILTYFGYTAIGFGVGGIIFKGRGAKDILVQFNIFKKSKNNEIEQLHKNKGNELIQVQSLTQNNAELQKLYNRSLRNLELKQLEVDAIQEELDNKVVKTEKETFDDFLSAKN